MIDLNFKYKNLISEVKSSAPFEPELAIILGSGLGNFAKRVDIIKTISTSNLLDYPKSTIQGHEGKIHFAEYSGKKLLLFQGRIHLYEGYSIYQCILPVFIAFKLNCRKIILTNAAGGVNPNFHPGDLILTTSFNGIMLKKELTNLIGISSEKGKKNFVNMPSQNLSILIKQAAEAEKIEMKEGVYWYTKGPSYETPAEIRFISKFGGDAVGMSTVHEAVFAGYLGIETSIISCITNYAAGLTKNKLSHSEVTETANLVQHKFERLIKKIIEIL
ncbi:MAG: purine-nucleoside phosphorylase [Ignavibacteriaceae bacterium]|nr:purine-nucleoside phosphorylase [Ignavibacteriaceae bacterium]